MQVHAPRADLQGWVFSSPRPPPTPCSFSLPPSSELGWGKGLGSTRSQFWYFTLFREVCSVSLVQAVCQSLLSCFRMSCICYIFVLYVVLGGGFCLTSHATIFKQKKLTLKLSLKSTFRTIMLRGFSSMAYNPAAHKDHWRIYIPNHIIQTNCIRISGIVPNHLYVIGILNNCNVKPELRATANKY